MRRSIAPARAVTGEEILGRLMLAFDGLEVPARIAGRLAEAPAAGFTLFRHGNVASPGQVRELTAALQHAAVARPGSEVDGLLLIATDQEGGQLLALGSEGEAGAGLGAPTAFPPQLALGAAGDPALTERVAHALGRELLAMGVTVNYAPCLDVISNTTNPALGTRSFGEDPAAVSAHGAAFVRGLQRAGVAATGKHFPGAGAVVADTHHELGVVGAEREALDARELAPFRASARAGVKLVMSGHFALPAITGDATLPSTVSGAVMADLLRGELGFRGVSITDALNMHALAQGAGQVIESIAALRAGVDLLLATPEPDQAALLDGGLRLAAARGIFDAAAHARSMKRIAALRRWTAGAVVPLLDVVGCASHREIAAEAAAASVTLVRDSAGLLPLRLAPSARLMAVMPAPRDLTPADTSSLVAPGLAGALRRHHPNVEGFVTSHPPTPAEIAALRACAPEFDAIVVGTINADAAQGALVDALLGSGRPVVTVALRVPWDLVAYPAAPTHVAAYSILPPTLAALADALFGAAPFRGRLPAAIPGLYPAGHAAAATADRATRVP